MNLPNQLTLLRIILVPFFVFFILMNQCPFNYFIALVIFSVASLTDWFDGRIARKRNIVTDFGKFMDPIADKLLVCAAFAVFTEIGVCSSWVLIFVLAREFAVSSLRMVAATTGKVIAANYWGKVKTASQMVVIILTLFLMELIDLGIFANSLWLHVIIGVSIWATVALTIISGVVYLVQNRKCLDYNK